MHRYKLCPAHACNPHERLHAACLASRMPTLCWHFRKQGWPLSLHGPTIKQESMERRLSAGVCHVRRWRRLQRRIRRPRCIRRHRRRAPPERLGLRGAAPSCWRKQPRSSSSRAPCLPSRAALGRTPILAPPLQPAVLTSGHTLHSVSTAKRLQLTRALHLQHQDLSASAAHTRVIRWA